MLLVIKGKVCKISLAFNRKGKSLFLVYTKLFQMHYNYGVSGKKKQ